MSCVCGAPFTTGTLKYGGCDGSCGVISTQVYQLPSRPANPHTNPINFCACKKGLLAHAGTTRCFVSGCGGTLEVIRAKRTGLPDSYVEFAVACSKCGVFQLPPLGEGKCTTIRAIRRWLKPTYVCISFGCKNHKKVKPDGASLFDYCSRECSRSDGCH
jgi:hypothetical protein